MKLATLKDGTPDGALAVVSDDGTRALKIGDSLPILLKLMEDWDAGQTTLAEAQNKLASGQGVLCASDAFAAPLPRSWQWLDGSAFSTHGDLYHIQHLVSLSALDGPAYKRFVGVFECFIQNI